MVSSVSREPAGGVNSQASRRRAPYGARVAQFTQFRDLMDLSKKQIQLIDLDPFRAGSSSTGVTQSSFARPLTLCARGLRQRHDVS